MSSFNKTHSFDSFTDYLLFPSPLPKHFEFFLFLSQEDPPPAKGRNVHSHQVQRFLDFLGWQNIFHPDREIYTPTKCQIDTFLYEITRVGQDLWEFPI